MQNALCHTGQRLLTKSHSSITSNPPTTHRISSRCIHITSSTSLHHNTKNSSIGFSTSRSPPLINHSSRRIAPCRSSATSSDIQVADPSTSTIGFVGLGIMGYPMALNLMKAGYKVICWNRSTEKSQSLATEAGAIIASTPAEVCDKSDIVIGMLADPAAALEVALGTDGIVSTMRPGKGYIDVSTVDVATSQQIANAVKKAGGQFLEAPVSGSKGPAEQGQLIFLTAGDEPLYQASKPLLDIMGKATFYLGDVGAGARMKLVVNMIMGSMMCAFSEGLTLADASGLDRKDLVDVLALGAMANPMFALKGPAMIRGEYPTAFPLKHQQKDMRLALELAQELGKSMVVAGVANELYLDAVEKGLADADFSAVVESTK